MDATLAPMLCEKADAVPTGEEWVLEPKLDGWRFVAHRSSDALGGVRMYGGRNSADYTGTLPYVEAELAARLPVGTTVDGELMSPLGFNRLGSVMRSAGAHRPSPESPALYYVLFDITLCSGQDVRAWPWRKRRELLENVDVSDAAYLRRSVAFPATDEAHAIFLEHGCEGSVAKRVDARYVNGRSRLWVKIKPQGDADARVTGFKAGTGDLDGLVGAFEVEMIDSGARTTVKCGTRTTHEDATKHPERWLGTVIELKHHGIGATGVPRHPQFFRRREDRT